MKPVHWYLAVSGVSSVAFLALPVGLAPARWARFVGWREDAVDEPLSLYFGRSLAAIGASMGAACFAGLARASDAKLFVLFLALVGLGATGVHAIGAIRREQPLREALEIPALAIWTLWGFWVHSAM